MREEWREPRTLNANYIHMIFIPSQMRNVEDVLLLLLFR